MLTGMSVEEFCLAHRLTASSILESIKRQVGIEGSDSVFLSGSLVEEGLGNAHSDLDAFIITDRDLSIHYSGMPIIAIPVGPIVIDLEWLRPAELRMLAERLRAFNKLLAQQDPRLALSWPTGALTVLHRTRIGMPMAGQEQFWSIKDSIDYGALLDLSFCRADAEIGNLQTDLSGFLEEGDEDGLRFAGRKLLGHVIDALLASFGNTNPSEKWRFRKLSILDSFLHSDDGVSFVGPASMTAFFRDLIEGQVCEQAGCGEWAYRSVRVANQIVSLCQILGEYPLASEAFRGVFQEVVSFSGGALCVDPRDDNQLYAEASVPSCLPQLALNHQVRCVNGEVLLYKLRGFHVLVLSRTARSVLPFFDGASNPRSVASYLASEIPSNSSSILQALLDMRLVFMAYGLTGVHS